jgi:hypothetical protein
LRYTAFFCFLRSRAFVGFYHSVPNSNANGCEHRCEKEHCAYQYYGIMRWGEQVLEWEEKTEPEGDDKSQNSLYDFGVYFHRVFCISREIVDELKQGAATLEFKRQGRD